MGPEESTVCTRFFLIYEAGKAGANVILTKAVVEQINSCMAKLKVGTTATRQNEVEAADSAREAVEKAEVAEEEGEAAGRRKQGKQKRQKGPPKVAAVFVIPGSNGHCS